MSTMKIDNVTLDECMKFAIGKYVHIVWYKSHSGLIIVCYKHYGAEESKKYLMPMKDYISYFRESIIDHLLC